MQALITLQGIGKEYKNQDIPALSDINLTIYPGEFIAITGASGSGKSTLLNILGLLTEPSHGSYTIEGKNLATHSEKARDELRGRYFGFIFQSSHVLGYETVYKNASLGLRTQNQPLEHRQEQAQSWLNKVGLASRQDALGKDLSGGERQRLAIARAMATKPAVLLADEPTGNLDSKNAALVFDQLKEINATGTTVIVITHDPQLAAKTNRQITLHDGKISSDTGSATPSAPSKDQKLGESKRTLAWLDDAFDALNYISVSPVKTLTLIFAFMLGVGGLIAAQGLSESASRQVSQTIAAAALDDVQLDIAPQANQAASKPQDLAGIKNTISSYAGVKTVSSQRALAASDYRPRNLAQASSTFSGSIYAVDSDYFDYIQAQVTNPHALWQLDKNRPVAFIGEDAAQELGIGNPYSGNGIIWLGGKSVTVLGIVKTSARDISASQNIYLNTGYDSPDPTQTFYQTSLLIRTDPGYPAPLAEALPLIINPAAPETVKVKTVGDLRNIQRGVSDNLANLVTGISWLLILLASLTSATTLYTSVQARKNEIALRRAIGASRTSIIRIFLFEGIFVGAAGGIAGASLGIFALVLTCHMLNWVPVISLPLALTGIVLGAITGMLAATYPALLAARAEPAEAIRA